MSAHEPRIGCAARARVTSFSAFEKRTRLPTRPASRHTHRTDAVTEYEAKDKDEVKRKYRIFTNIQENIPFHSALLTGAVFVVSIKNSDLNDTLAALVITYTTLRTTWFIACNAGKSSLAKPKPSQLETHARADPFLMPDSNGINGPLPFRSLSFMFSVLVMFGVLGVSIAAAFK